MSSNEDADEKDGNVTSFETQSKILQNVLCCCDQTVTQTDSQPELQVKMSEFVQIHSPITALIPS